MLSTWSSTCVCLKVAGYPGTDQLWLAVWPGSVLASLPCFTSPPASDNYSRYILHCLHELKCKAIRFGLNASSSWPMTKWADLVPSQLLPFSELHSVWTQCRWSQKHILLFGQVSPPYDPTINLIGKLGTPGRGETPIEHLLAGVFGCWFVWFSLFVFSVF